MMMMMMVQSCQSIPKAPPPLSPALHPPDQQQSFKQKPKHFCFCRSVVLVSFALIFIFLSSPLPPPLLHSHTPLYSVQRREPHTYTPTSINSLLLTMNSQSWFSVCVCAEGGGLYSCPLTGGGGHHFFQSKRILSFLCFFEMCPSFPLSLYLYLTWRK